MHLDERTVKQLKDSERTSMRIEPAVAARLEDGTPFSPQYGDIYHSADGGIAQSRHVFLSGNGLPTRWAQREVFTIVETGFGLGLNFLVTWQTWRDDPERCSRLHFVSVEKHPFLLSDLAALHATYPELAALSAQLRGVWPQRVPGTHRLHFESGQVTLTLIFADATAGLAQLRCTADAFFLDGFAPERNPDMWTPDLLKRCARVAHPRATLTTYTTASAVRANLQAAGFSVSKQPGYGRKRHMLVAQYRPPSWINPRLPLSIAANNDRQAIIVGAGLAGAAVSERMAARGWNITLIERLDKLAGGTSGLHAGVTHPHLSRDDCVLSRLVRNGFLYAVAAWRALKNSGYTLPWHSCGVAQPARDDLQAREMSALVKAHAYPENYVQFFERAELSNLCGTNLAHGGYWFAQGSWIQPTALVQALVEKARARLCLNTDVDKILYVDGLWQALAADESMIAEAPVMVLANSADASRLAPIAHTLRRIRGQMTYLQPESFAVPRSIVAGHGYVLPPVGGIVATGSTYDLDNRDMRPTIEGHQRNLSAMKRLLPDVDLSADCNTLDGFVGFRTAAIDRLPLIGAMPDIDTVRTRVDRLHGAHLKDIPRLPGLYGVFGYASRGLTWASLGGELIASMIHDEPSPLEGNLADAIDPARMLLKRVRRQQPV